MGIAKGRVPKWIRLIPAGVFAGRDGRGPFVNDDPEAIIAATRQLQMEGGLPIDYDHAIDFAAPEGRPAPASGWIRELRKSSGAVWGRIEWTARAIAALMRGEYRYISPVFQYDPETGRVQRILHAGLTNNPNLYGAAITAGAARPNKYAICSLLTPPRKESMMTMTKQERAICAQLGLSENDYLGSRNRSALPRAAKTRDAEIARNLGIKPSELAVHAADTMKGRQVVAENPIDDGEIDESATPEELAKQAVDLLQEFIEGDPDDPDRYRLLGKAGGFMMEAIEREAPPYATRLERGQIPAE
jgi:phage I-like protein